MDCTFVALGFLTAGSALSLVFTAFQENDSVSGSTRIS